MFGVKANSVALLGKAPCQGDFIRWNASDPVSAQFHKWLEEGHEAVRRANLTLSAEPICFVYSAAGGRQALLGMMAPSSDKVGRQFPLTVYVPVDLGPISGNAATLYGSHQAFFAGFLPTPARPGRHPRAPCPALHAPAWAEGPTSGGSPGPVS